MVALCMCKCCIYVCGMCACGGGGDVLGAPVRERICTSVGALFLAILVSVFSERDRLLKSCPELCFHDSFIFLTADGMLLGS